MARKTLLNESEIRRFMKLANVKPVGDQRLSEMGGYMSAKRDDEDEEPGMRDEMMEQEEEEMDMKMDMDEKPAEDPMDEPEMDDMDGDKEDVEADEEEEADLEENSTTDAKFQKTGMAPMSKGSAGANVGYETAKTTKGSTGYDAGSKALQERFQKLANIIK